MASFRSTRRATSPRMPAPLTVDTLEILVNLEGLIDVAAERKRREKEIDRLHISIKGKKSKLSNEKFVANAPPDIIAREREGLVQLEEQLRSAVAGLAELPIN